MRLVLLKATRRISNEMDLDLRVWTSSLKNSLGGGFNPFEKYPRQIGSFPQVMVKKNMKPPPSSSTFKKKRSGGMKAWVSK